MLIALNFTWAQKATARATSRSTKPIAIIEATCPPVGLGFSSKPMMPRTAKTPMRSGIVMAAVIAMTWTTIKPSSRPNLAVNSRHAVLKTLPMVIGLGGRKDVWRGAGAGVPTGCGKLMPRILGVAGAVRAGCRSSGGSSSAKQWGGTPTTCALG